MVWNDYELISTNRVNKDRRGGFSPLMRRQFSALGGWNTVFTAAFFGSASTAFGLQQSSLLVLEKPAMTQAGMTTFARSALKASGPALLGVGFGIMMFGDYTELRNLQRNAFTYGSEMKAIRRELYHE